jgi:hypothetical protein
MASKQSKLELNSVVGDEITLLTLKEHFGIITGLIDDETKVLEMSDADLGANIKLALALDITIKYFGG